MIFMLWKFIFLGNKTSKTSFKGYCRDKAGGKDIIDYIPVKDKSECHRNCNENTECVAFAFNRNNINRENCDLYRKGPYIYGSGINGITCYVIL